MLSPKARILIGIGALVLIIVLYKVWGNQDPCKDRITYDMKAMRQEIDLAALYRPLDSMEIARHLAEWQDFEARPDSVRWLEQINSYVRKGQLVQTVNEGQGHYGAVFPPQNLQEGKSYPLLIWANGLDQSQPRVDLTNRREIKALLKQLPGYFIIIPSFRGQALAFSGKSYCSDGFFGDAFDGATDDALRLLEATLHTYPEADTNRLAIYGVSRGGTVALLAGIRDPRIQCIISQAGPTDFFGKEFLARYGFQYRYQFFSWTNEVEAMRARIIQSSPLHFIDTYRDDLLIIHGRNDEVVSISHARNLIASASQADSLITDAGHNGYEMKKVISWLKGHN